MAEASGSRQVVIVGGGFAGLFAARALRNAPVQVTLLDRAEHHLFQPMLYQYSTGIVSSGKIAFPLRELLHKLRNLELVLAEVTGIDAERRRVLARRPQDGQIEFGYDYLILAAGVRQSYFGHDRLAVRRHRAGREAPIPAVTRTSGPRCFTPFRATTRAHIGRYGRLIPSESRRTVLNAKCREHR